MGRQTIAASHSHSCHLGLQLHVLHHLVLHLLNMCLFPLRRKNIHSFEIQSTDTPHECFLKTLLHVGFLIVIRCDLRISVFKSLAQLFNLFHIVMGDRLDLGLDSFLELLFVLLGFPYSVLLVPRLEDPA